MKKSTGVQDVMFWGDVVLVVVYEVMIEVMLAGM